MQKFNLYVILAIEYDKYLSLVIGYVNIHNEVEEIQHARLGLKCNGSE